MRRTLGCGILAIAGLQAQSFYHVTGTVVDSEGKPVAGVSIDHAGNLRHAYGSDSDGKFALDTSAPALVFRKLGYRSEWYKRRRSVRFESFVRLIRPSHSRHVQPPLNMKGLMDGPPHFSSSEHRA